MKYDAKLVSDKVVAMMDPADRKALGLKTVEERQGKAEEMAEKELQRLCENWLTLHGFRRRTPEGICRPGYCAGWFIHIHEAKRNPILLDLLVLFNDGRYVEGELKTKTGKLSDEQLELVKRGGLLWRTLEEFIEAVERKLT